MDFRKEGIYLEKGKGQRTKIGYEYKPYLGTESHLFREKDERTDLVMFKFLAGSAIVEEDMEKVRVFIDIKPTTLTKFTNDVVQFYRGGMILDVQPELVSKDILKKIRSIANKKGFTLCLDDFGENLKRSYIEILQPDYIKVDLDSSQSRTDLALWALDELRKAGSRARVIAKNVSEIEELERLSSFGIVMWQGRLERKLTLLG